ncbi:hypothetical protein [Poseidonibacter ostreae]|uniref:Uncharacterized protein n=1 Tax=Poseidonibacter ostreae TaxID=2654171 RepID=A0ABQ6VNE1_9BACT|nr:hypothetical protein [Poseidonibacter ostreae]KAB7891528.1 hypothetical protein GBG18_06605 [Poseidonibacter ostreae]
MQIERLEERKETLKEVKRKLTQVILPQIKSNTKAHFGIRNFRNELTNEIYTLESNIKILLNQPDKYMNLKISNSIMKKIIDLNNTIPSMTLLVFLEFILDLSKDLLFSELLTEIANIEINEKTELLLNQTDFYVCKKKDEKEDKVIVYKIDDLIVFEDGKHLNLEHFEHYSFNNYNFLFSSKYTLLDIKKFKNIW